MRSRGSTLVLLLAAEAVRAWWGPVSAEESSDPFWTDGAACDAGRWADARPRRETTRGRALTRNLLKNGGPNKASMDGWTTVDGGDGWSATQGAFKTSYEPNTRRQIVSLLDHVDAKVLDSGAVVIVLGEQVTETGSRDKYFIRAALCADAECDRKVARWAPCRCEEEELESACTLTEAYCVTQGSGKRQKDLGHDPKGPKGGDRTRDDAWHTLTHTFSSRDVIGARYLLFEDGGCSGEYWEGLWGPWFRRATAKVHAVSDEEDPPAGWTFVSFFLFVASVLFSLLLLYAYAKDPGRLAVVDEETSLLSRREDEGPVDGEQAHRGDDGVEMPPARICV